MDYKKIYQSIVDRALLRNKIYPAERHHILPRSMGGKDRKSNIVYFTPREHLIAHILLWKIYRNKSMSHALWMMCHTRGVKINSKQYEILRLDHSKNIKESLTGIARSDEFKEKIRVANIGKKHTEESKEKMSNSRKGKPSGRKGFLHTAESKKKNSESNKGHKRNIGRIVTEEIKQKIREANIGKKASSEAREKMRLAALNRKKLVD